MLQDLQHHLALQFDYHVLVVDDGSSDDTSEVALEFGETMPVSLIPHSVNQGLAAAIRTGLSAASARCGDRDIIITMDADNTHPIGLIPSLVAKSNQGFDVVVASRFRRQARVMGVPAFRKLTSIGVAVMFKVLFPIRGIRDYTCGFRAYKGNVMKAALQEYGDDFVSEEGFSCMVDILLKLSRKKLVLGEVPMVLRYDLKDGASKMNVGSTITDTLKLAYKRRMGVMN